MAIPLSISNDDREQLTRDALLHGNGYAYIGRVGGRPVELVRLNPAAAVSVNVDLVTGEPSYSVSGNAVDSADIIHIRAPSINGYLGESPVMLAREAIGLALVMEQKVKTASLPEGERALPVAGFIYFSYGGKTSGIHSMELIYDGAAGKVKLPLQ